MANPPTFFFSHARQDREMPGRYLARFFEDLEKRLASAVGIELSDGRRLGTIDSRIKHGKDWDQDLSGSLAGDRAFIAIYSPLYFNRENCGKELAIFLRRNPALGIDVNGSLTNVTNVLAIRWYGENFYAANTENGAVIPKLLRLIEDTPADNGDDEERTSAIRRYRTKGMERCVASEPHYTELLNLFVQSIRDMVELPVAKNVSFATAPDAFKYDWAKHFAARGASVSAGGNPVRAVATVPLAPRALTSIVIFYVTARHCTFDANKVEFADQLIAEPLQSAPTPTDLEFASLLHDVRAAGTEENLTVFHAAADPIVPTQAATYVSRLAGLSRSAIPVAIVLDPAIWPDGNNTNGEAIDQVIRSAEWDGIVILPVFDAAEPDVEPLTKDRNLPPRLVTLPRATGGRIAALRRAFVDARGRVMRNSARHSPGAESLPLLQSTDPSPR